MNKTMQITAIAGLMFFGVSACTRSANVTDDENTLVTCRDGQDNDRDGLIDCDDEDCAPFPGCLDDSGSENSSDTNIETDSASDADTDADTDTHTDASTDSITDSDTETDTFDITMSWSTIPAGSFWMGSPWGDCPPDYPAESCILEATNSENLHYVTLTRSFEIMRHEVTQNLYSGLMGWNPSNFGPNGEGPDCGGNCPVEGTSWFDAVAFANQYSLAFSLPTCYGIGNVTCQDDTVAGSDYMACMNPFQQGIKSASVSLNMLSSPYQCSGYRLPTESEWEYAARAGSLTAIYPSEGNDGTVTEWIAALDSNLDQVAWYALNSEVTTHPVARKEANAWGLYDMLGNSLEWTGDWREVPYPDGDTMSPVGDPIGPGSGEHRVVRGGDYNTVGVGTRSAQRSSYLPGLRAAGIRIVRTLLE